MMVTKEAFEHFKGVYERHTGWEVDNETKAELDKEWQKMRNTMWRIKFSYQCLYPNEKPLTKRDYGRLKFTERTIQSKMGCISQVRTHEEVEVFNRGCRRLQIGKGLYPFGIRESEAIEKYDEIRLYYEEGKYKRGGFVDKFIAHIHHI